jgi:hypothetical protein
MRNKLNDSCLSVGDNYESIRNDKRLKKHFAHRVRRKVGNRRK